MYVHTQLQHSPTVGGDAGGLAGGSGGGVPAVEETHSRWHLGHSFAKQNTKSNNLCMANL